MKKSGLRIILTGLLLMSILQSFAAIVTAERAGQVARNFYTEKRMAAEPNASFSLLNDRIIPITVQNSTLIYVVCFDDAGGFVLVAGDDRIQPVLGYAFNGIYGSKDFPEAYSELLNNYKLQIQNTIKRLSFATPAVSKEWKNYSDAVSFQAKSVEAQVMPMVTTTWNQDCNYNDSCPSDINSWSCGHVPTGCVATCLAQIIRYHAYPATGAGMHSFVHPVYGTLSANFGNTTYNYASMPDYLNTPNADVAQLIYHCGVGIDMGYATYESGASSSNAALALVHYFQYSDSLRLLQRVDYNDVDWNNIIRNEMDHSRPIYYAGYGPNGGHAFVCDGYQTSTYFHFNWGWSGYYNGYFYLNNLDPGSNTFNDNQEIIIGIEPGTPAPCSAKVLTAKAGDFNDGSYTSDYGNNQSCSWLIQPSVSAAYVSLEFITFNTESINDVVKVYDGSSNTALLMGTYSGSSLPPVISTSGGALYLEFLTNGSLSKPGWSAHYATHYCYPSTILTGTAGYFSDGSGSDNYNDMTDCYWLIQPTLPVNIALLFNSFDTELDYDSVTVYDGATIQDPVLGSYTGNTIPPVLYSTGNKMLVHFYADQGVSETGWDAVYSTSVGVPGVDNPGAISIYPNPAKNNVMLLMPNNKMTGIKISLTDISGRKIRDFNGSEGSGLNQMSLSLDGIAPGIYSLLIDSNEGRIVKKLVVE